MEWSDDAKQAIDKVPFFVRKRVRKKVEEEASLYRSDVVRIEHVQSTQRRFLNNMENEVRGFQVEGCFGLNGCPNQATKNEKIMADIETLLDRRNIREFLLSKVVGPLRLHHQFRVSISDCPNACSRPQIVDIGLIGARQPILDPTNCNLCSSCKDICKEDAILFDSEQEPPILDDEKCLSCGQCIDACTTGAIKQLRTGYRVLLGGKLGRHPRLGTEIGGIFSSGEVLRIVKNCLEHYFRHNKKGERFGETLCRQPLDIAQLKP